MIVSFLPGSFEFVMNDSISIRRKIIKPEKRAMAIVIGMLLGFQAMYLTFVFDAHVFVSMAALMIPMVAAITFFMQYSQVTISKNGVTQKLVPYISWWTRFKSPEKRHFRWTEVVSYRDDEEWQRYKGNRRFIYLKMKDGYKIEIQEGDDANASDFTAFRDALMHYIEAAEAGTLNQQTA